MKRKSIKKILMGTILAMSLPLIPASHLYAQENQGAGAFIQSSADDANSDEESEESITNREVDGSINDAYRVNAPVIRNYKYVDRKYIISPHKDIPFNRQMIFMGLPNQTYDALGNSPVNNNSGAYNPNQAVNMPQSTITQPPLPYKYGGTYYQANDSLLRPAQKNW